MAFTARPSPPMMPTNGLGRGLESGIQALADRIERKREADKLLVANAKAADALFKNNPAFQKTLGMSADEFAAAGATDKIAMMQAAVTHVTLQQAQAKAAREQAEAENLARFPKFAEAVSQMGQEPESLPMVLNEAERARRMAPVNFQGVMGAAARTGYRPEATMMDDLIRANAQPAKMSVVDAMNMARTPPAGFGQGKVSISSTGTPSLQFDPAMPTEAIPLPLAGGGQTGKAMLGDKIIDLPQDRSKALTDAQANALQFSERMKSNNDIIEKLTEGGFNPAGLEGFQGWVPNFLASEDYQQYETAAENWVAAVLRKESGASISASEEERAMKQYFPRIGDKAAVVQQKAELRRLAEKNMRKAIGDINRPDGKTEEKVEGAPSKAPPELLEEARKALKPVKEGGGGKDPKAVKARYKELTGEEYPE